MKASASPLPRRLWLALGAASLLALLQQQILERRPPRLLQLESQASSSGPAALDLQFSRPMQRRSLQRDSRLQPPLAHRWLGSDTHQRLLLLPDQRVKAAISLEVRGSDQRGRRLPPQRWHWDPRPHLLVVAPVKGGEQLQLRTHAGEWRPLTPIWPRIASVEPMADGRGVVVLAGDPQGALRLWWRRLRPRSLLPGSGRSGPPVPGALEPLVTEPLNFAHLSSNRRGELLLQLGGLAPGSSVRSLWIERHGRRRQLPLQSWGPIRLLPEGEGMVVPTPEGLELRPLAGGDDGAQVLPGSRVLASFCPASGEAILIRHWPDYRRSLERVQPGGVPQTVWVGQEAVLAASCDPSGDRIWLLLNRWDGQSSYELWRLDRGSRRVFRRQLAPWRPEPGTPMGYDPVTDQLLLTLRRDPRQPAQPALLEGRTLRLRILPDRIRQAQWLPAG